MNIIVLLLVILLASAIAFYIVRNISLPPDLQRIGLLIIGIIFLIAVVMVILPIIGISVPYYPRP